MLRPIKSDKQYEEYLERAYELMQMDLKPDSKNSDELEVLSILIENYETENFPIDPPNPIDAIFFRLDQMNLDKSDLNKILGSRSRTSEILNGKRKLSLAMIRRLNAKLKIPAEILIRDYELEHAR
jgi:HTH-type transcriptional regulator / antitoxin HigA